MGVVVPGKKNIQFKYFPFFYGCHTGSVTLRDEYRMSDFQKLLLTNMFGAKVERYQKAGKEWVIMNYIICILRQI